MHNAPSVKHSSVDEIAENSRNKKANDNLYSDDIIANNENEKDETEDINTTADNSTTEESLSKEEYQDTRVPESLNVVSSTDKQNPNISTDANASSDERNISILPTDILEPEQSLVHNANTSSTLKEHYQNASVENTPDLECGNDNKVDQVNKSSRSCIGANIIIIFTNLLP